MSNTSTDEGRPIEHRWNKHATLNDNVADQVRFEAAQPGLRNTPSLFKLLRVLAKWRADLLGYKVWDECQGRIAAGPFAGMRYFNRAVEGGATPRLLGNYEAELQPFIEGFIAKSFERIAVAGCAEGYYAIGFALRCPRSIVSAFDTNEKARDRCKELSQMNGVSDRVTIDGGFSPTQLKHPTRTFLFCDIDGAEAAMMDPDRFAVLRSIPALIVECHDYLNAGITERLTAQFSQSHDVQLVENSFVPPVFPASLKRLGHLDQLLALWEWREYPTPWLVMTKRLT